MREKYDRFCCAKNGGLEFITCDTKFLVRLLKSVQKLRSQGLNHVMGSSSMDFAMVWF